MEPLPAADLAYLGIPPLARTLVRRTPAVLRHSATARHDSWGIAVRGHGDGTLEADDPMRLVREGPILDLLTFDPLKPEPWTLARDAVLVLGAIEPQFLDPAPVPVHRTPVDWLRASGEGIVLLGGDRHDRRRMLGCCRGGIVAGSPAHGAQLKMLMSQPAFETRIFVRQRETAG
jgi:hypothetical protein